MLTNYYNKETNNEALIKMLSGKDSEGGADNRIPLEERMLQLLAGNNEKPKSDNSDSNKSNNNSSSSKATEAPPKKPLLKRNALGNPIEEQKEIASPKSKKLKAENSVISAAINESTVTSGDQKESSTAKEKNRTKVPQKQIPNSFASREPPKQWDLFCKKQGKSKTDKSLLTLTGLQKFADFLAQEAKTLPSAVSYISTVKCWAATNHSAVIDQNAYNLLITRVKTAQKSCCATPEQALIVAESNLESLTAGEKFEVRVMCAMGQRCASLESVSDSKITVTAEEFRVQITESEKRNNFHTVKVGLSELSDYKRKTTIKVIKEFLKKSSKNKEKQIQGLINKLCKTESKISRHSFRRTGAILTRVNWEKTPKNKRVSWSQLISNANAQFGWKEGSTKNNNSSSSSSKNSGAKNFNSTYERYSQDWVSWKNEFEGPGSHQELKAMMQHVWRK